MKDSFISQSDQLIKKQQYRDALDILFSIWKSTPDADVAERILLCFRKVKRFDQYEKWLSIFKSKFNGMPFLAAEEKELMLGKKLGDVLKGESSADVCKSAEALLALEAFTAEETANLHLSVVTRLKQLEAWELAKEWIEKIDPAYLSDKTTGERSTSPKKRYNLSLEDIYIALGDFEKLAELFRANEGALRDSLVSKKRALSAMISAKQFAEAERFCAAEISPEKPNWHFVEQMAKIQLALGNADAAWEHACRAFNTKGGQKHKLELHLILSDIAMARGNAAFAADFKTLTILVRAQEKLAISDELMAHLATVKDQAVTAEQLMALHKAAIVEGVNLGKEKHMGEVVWFPLDKNFARLRYADGKNTIIFKSDLEDDCHYQGAKVDFFLHDTIDPKTGKASQIAKYGTKHFKLG